ncbi:MAG: RidA family protein [Acidobacteriota bacterium]|nr:RidA family protein [Acidobacteriota bacterium]MDH3530398.1 RidA family protein [Acidobacteriota bacterium]
MSEIEKRLTELGETLPEPPEHVANYLGCKRSGTTLYVSARVSEALGEVGVDLTLEEAKLAAKETMLIILAIIKKEIGELDQIKGVLKMNGFVRSSIDFTKQPLVIDGASDLLVALWGEAGRHTRTATGTSQLPFGAAVQLELVMELY